MSLADLREEYERETIGALIYAEVVGICSRVTRRYSPQVYARAEDWSTALDDLVQEVVVERLLGEGQLAFAMTQAADEGHWRALIERQVRRTLARRRSRTVVDNLLERAAGILSRPPFRVHEAGRTVEYSRADRDADARRPTDDEVRTAIAAAATVSVVLGHGDERAPMVYSTAALGALLSRATDALPSRFTRNDLDRIFRALLTQWTASDLVDIEGALQLPSESLTPEEQVVVNDIADRILAATSAEGRHIFRAKLRGTSDGDLARELGLSRPTVAQRKSALYERVRAELEGLPQATADAAVSRLEAALAESRWSES